MASPSLRSSSSKLAQLTLEQILEHLDNLRLNLTNTKQNCAPPSLRLRPLELGGAGAGADPPGCRLRTSRHLTALPPSPPSF